MLHFLENLEEEYKAAHQIYSSKFEQVYQDDFYLNQSVTHLKSMGKS